MPLPTQPHEYTIQRIKEALAADPRAGELALEVEIANETVYLRGTVATESRRRAITEVVTELLPDCDIQNETTVEDLRDASIVEKIQ